jgi:hypothetical protein
LYIDGGRNLTRPKKRIEAIEENTEIVPMDTLYGRPHLDKEYIPPEADAKKKAWLDQGYSYARMKRYLLANWKRFVHGALEYGW